MANPLFDTLFGKHAGNDAVFLHLPDGRTITYVEFLELAAQYAGLLCELGLKPGDRLAVQIAKSPQALAVYAACAQAGIVFLPLNTAYTGPEVAYFITDATPRVLVCDPARLDELSPLAGDATVMTLDKNGTGTLTADLPAPDPAFQPTARGPNDLAAILYTSGTTGRSKGAMLSHKNLASNSDSLRELWRFTPDDVLIHALPIFHTHGLFVATNVALLSGASVVFLPKFDANAILDAMPNATSLMGVPTFYTRLLDDPRLTPDHARNMRLFISGSAPLLVDTHEQWEQRTGHRILERYGMTETNMSTSNPYDAERRAGTVGFPLPGVELRIMEDGAEVAQGDIGVIEVRGDNVFQGYWQMPEKTAEELRPDGWFIYGDLAIQDADGYVTIVGRAKDLIITGGFNVYPKEIEGLIDDLPGVVESAVIGVPHPDFGETVVGILVAQGDAKLDLAAIEGGIKASLARFKHPKRLIVLPELPRNTMGKVQKKALRDQFKDLFSV